MESTAMTIGNQIVEFKPIIIKDGRIIYDFTELKQKVKEISSIYELTEYSDDVDKKIKEMKADRATLNKAKELIDAERKKTKKMFLKPLEIFEEACNEIFTMFEEPRKNIDSKVKELENEKKKRRKKEIRDYYEIIADEIPDDFKEEFFNKIYSLKWENANATKKSYMEGIEGAIKDYKNAISIISGFDSFYKEKAMAIYKENLDLDTAILYMQRKEKEKEEILKRESEAIEKNIRNDFEKEMENEKNNYQNQLLTIKAEYQKEMETVREQNSNNKVKDITETEIFLKVSNGVIVSIYGDPNVKITLLDDALCSQRELLAFEQQVKGKQELY